MLVSGIAIQIIFSMFSFATGFWCFVLDVLF